MKLSERELKRKVRETADLLGLRDWTIRVKARKPRLKNRCAECMPIYGRKHASIRFDPSLLRSSDLDQTIIHELVHLHLQGWWDLCFRDLGSVLSDDAYDVFIAGVRRQMEYGVDALADVIVRLMAHE